MLCTRLASPTQWLGSTKENIFDNHYIETEKHLAGFTTSYIISKKIFFITEGANSVDVLGSFKFFKIIKQKYFFVRWLLLLFSNDSREVVFAPWEQFEAGG